MLSDEKGVQMFEIREPDPISPKAKELSKECLTKGIIAAAVFLAMFTGITSILEFITSTPYPERIIYSLIFAVFWLGSGAAMVAYLFLSGGWWYVAHCYGRIHITKRKDAEK